MALNKYVTLENLSKNLKAYDAAKVADIRSKVENISERAEANKIDSISVNNTAITPDENKNVNIPVPTLTDILDDETKSTTKTYSSDKISSLINAISSLKLKIVDELPTEDISTSTIYLVPKASSGTNNAYTEYVYVDESWEKIGDTELKVPGWGTQSQDIGTESSAGSATTMSRSDHVHALPTIEQSNSTSAVSPGSGGSFAVIDSVTVDSQGRLTGKNVKTVTLPDLTSGTADYLNGFTSKAGSQTWGNQTGTFITGMGDSTGGNIAWRRDNPSDGQMSMVLDGTVYVNEGTDKVATESQIPTLSSLIMGTALTSSNPISTTNPARIDAGKIAVHTVYNASGPATYGNLFNIGGSGGCQIFLEWSGSQTAAGDSNYGGIWYRTMRDSMSGWTAWSKMWTSKNLSFSVSGSTCTITYS